MEKTLNNMSIKGLLLVILAMVVVIMVLTVINYLTALGINIKFVNINESVNLVRGLLRKRSTI